MKNIKIEGMSCRHCVMAVKKALEDIEGIAHVKVDLANGEATFDEMSPVSKEIIKEHLEKAGYRLG